METTRLEIDFPSLAMPLREYTGGTFEAVADLDSPRFRIDDGPWQILPAGARLEERDGRYVLVTR